MSLQWCATFMFMTVLSVCIIIFLSSGISSLYFEVFSLPPFRSFFSLKKTYRRPFLRHLTVWQKPHNWRSKPEYQTPKTKWKSLANRILKRAIPVWLYRGKLLIFHTNSWLLKWTATCTFMNYGGVRRLPTLECFRQQFCPHKPFSPFPPFCLYLSISCSAVPHFMA